MSARRTPASSACSPKRSPPSCSRPCHSTGNADVYKPHFSPDGAKILFGCQTSKHKSTDGDICTMHADGTNVTDITNTPFYRDGSGWENLMALGTAPLL
jgi:hypothetical protein